MLIYENYYINPLLSMFNCCDLQVILIFNLLSTPPPHGNNLFPVKHMLAFDKRF